MNTSASPSDKKVTVLFVDDEQHILTSLRAIFRSQYNVLIANSGADALEIIQQQHVHVIVSDQRMPKMLGSQLLAQVREQSPHTMRLLLTGYSDMGSITQSINEGEVFRFITKPWDNDDIQEIVRNAAQIALRTQLAPNTERQPASTTDTVAETDTDIDVTQAPALLALTASKDTADTIEDLFSQDYSLLGAESIDEALAYLTEHEVAVVIADTRIDDDEGLQFIKILKQEHPLLVTIVLANEMDSETAIGLINQGQIYRYLTKPLTRSVFRLSVKQAFQHYQRNKSKPWLLERYEVAQPKQVENASFTARIRSSLHSLRDHLKLK